MESQIKDVADNNSGDANIAESLQKIEAINDNIQQEVLQNNQQVHNNDMPKDQAAIDAYKRLQMIKDAINEPPAALTAVTQQLPLSICVIYNAQDRDLHLEKFYKRMPRNIECCFLETVPNKDNRNAFELVREIDDNNNNHIKFGRWHYPEALFSFADARNNCKDLATRDWILCLDMDERLNYNLDEFMPFFNLSNKMIAAVAVYVFDVLVSDSAPHGVLSGNAQYRMFRNYPEIKYKGIVHENINDSLRAYNYQTTLSGITVKHTGYGVSDEINIKKAWRNTVLGIRDIVTNGFDKYRFSKLYDSLHFLDLQKQLPKDETNNKFVQSFMKG